MPKDVKEFSLDRPEYYDRHPTVTFTQATNSQVAPHADTVYNAYTVPTARAFMGTSVSIAIKRRTVATTAGEFYMRLVTPQANHELRDYLNALSQYVTIAYPCFCFAKAGAHLDWHGRDLSTGGQLDWFCGIDGIEFDA